MNVNTTHFRIMMVLFCISILLMLGLVLYQHDKISSLQSQNGSCLTAALAYRDEAEQLKLSLNQLPDDRYYSDTPVQNDLNGRSAMLDCEG